MIDSTGSFIAGYVVTTVIYAGYILVLWRRARTVQQRLRELKANPSSLRSS